MYWNPNGPTDVPFNDIVTQTRMHFYPTPSDTIQKYLFNSRSGRPGESVLMYAAELKMLAEFCNFKETLELILHDRIACEIGNELWQRHLLSEEDLTYKRPSKLDSLQQSYRAVIILDATRKDTF